MKKEQMDCEGINGERDKHADRQRKKEREKQRHIEKVKAGMTENRVERE